MSITIDWLFKNFITECSAYNKSRPTIRSYESSYRKLQAFNPAIPGEYIHTINKQFVKSYTVYLSESDISTASVNHYIRDLRVFLYWCMENEYVLPFSVHLVKENQTLKDPYSREEISVLLRRPLISDTFIQWRDWAIINWVLGVASRASTIVNLLMQDIDLKEERILTRHNKNGKIYSVAMPPQLKKVLLEYMRHRVVDSEYLFCSIDGEKLQVGGLSHSIAKYNQSRGINKTSTHLFRHSFGALWAENGGDVYRLQKIFNHSDIRTTQKYINLYGNNNDDDKFLEFNPLQSIKKKT